MSHLDREDEWSNYCESIEQHISDEVWDTHEDFLTQSEGVIGWFDTFNRYSVRPETAALVIELLIKRKDNESKH